MWYEKLVIIARTMSILKQLIVRSRSLTTIHASYQEGDVTFLLCYRCEETLGNEDRPHLIKCPDLTKIFCNLLLRIHITNYLANH